MLTSVFAISLLGLVSSYAIPSTEQYEFEKDGPHGVKHLPYVNHKMNNETTKCVDPFCNVQLVVAVPTSVNASMTSPLVVVSNGFQQDCSKYTYLLSRFASYGMVAICWNTYENAFVYPTHSSRGYMSGEVIEWVQTPIARDLFAKESVRVDPHETGVMMVGHSAGGKSSLFASLHSPHKLLISGVVALDPVGCAPPTEKDYSDDFPNLIPQMPDMDIPVLFIGSEYGPTGLVSCAPKDCSYEQMYKSVSHNSWKIMVSASGHEEFYETIPRVNACRNGNDIENVHSVTTTAMIAWSHFALFNQDISEYTRDWAIKMASQKKLVHEIK